MKFDEDVCPSTASLLVSLSFVSFLWIQTDWHQTQIKSKEESDWDTLRRKLHHTQPNNTCYMNDFLSVSLRTCSNNTYSHRMSSSRRLNSIIYWNSLWWKVGWSFVVYETFLEINSKTASQHFPKHLLHLSCFREHCPDLCGQGSFPVTKLIFPFSILPQTGILCWISSSCSLPLKSCLLWMLYM